MPQLKIPFVKQVKNITGKNPEQVTDITITFVDPSAESKQESGENLAEVILENTPPVRIIITG